MVISGCRGMDGHNLIKDFLTTEHTEGTEEEIKDKGYIGFFMIAGI